MEELLNKRIGKAHVICNMVADECPDLDWLGTYSNQPGPYAIETGRSGNYYKYFNPPFENYKGCPEDEMEKYCHQDFERMEAYNRGDWMMVGIRATVYINGAEIANDSLWGIDYDYSVQDYHLEVMRDVVWQAIKDTREWLAELQEA